MAARAPRAGRPSSCTRRPTITNARPASGDEDLETVAPEAQQSADRSRRNSRRRDRGRPLVLLAARNWLEGRDRARQPSPASTGSTTATRTMVLSRSGQTPSHSSGARAGRRSARDPREDGSVERTRPRVGAFEGLRPVLCRRRAPAFLGGEDRRPHLVQRSEAAPVLANDHDRITQRRRLMVSLCVRDRAADCPRYRGCSVGRGRGSAGCP